MKTWSLFFFFFNDTATTEIYTLSLHDALPIWVCLGRQSPCPAPGLGQVAGARVERDRGRVAADVVERSEEHTSELQSRQYLVCRLLLEKKKKHNNQTYHNKQLMTRNIVWTDRN